MSQYRDLGEGTSAGKMAISYASGMTADHTPALPSFREVSLRVTNYPVAEASESIKQKKLN